MKSPKFKNTIAVTGTALLLLLFGVVVSINAEKNHSKQDSKPPKQQQQENPGYQKQHQQARPSGREQQQQIHGQQKQQETNRPSAQVQPEQRNMWQQHRARSWQTEHRTWKQRGGYNGYRIPKHPYRNFFGRNHRFRINTLSFRLFDGATHFHYGGYWFNAVDPWPEYWSDNWYDNDDVYIDYYGGGYYLYNHRHPRDRIAITIYLN